MDINELLQYFWTELSEVSSNLFIAIPACAFTFLAAKTDIDSLKIPNRLTKTFLFLRFIVASLLSVLMLQTFGIDIGLSLNTRPIAGLLFGFLILFLPAFIKGKPMGGDIKFAAVLGAWIGAGCLFISLWVTIVLFFLFLLIKPDFIKKQSIPFAPFMGCGYVITMLVTQLVILFR